MIYTDWRFFALASALFAGLTAVLGKIGVNGINSNFATAIRTFVVLILASCIVISRKEYQPWNEISSRALLFLIASGFTTAASWLCYYRALQLGPVSKVAPIDKLSIVFAIFIAVVFLGEQLSLKMIIGALLISAGAFVLVL